jgi:hypothetical protein
VDAVGELIFKENMFFAARHMVLAFWMKTKAETEAPNAEVFGYGEDENDHYFRTGWGCTATDFVSCYWIFVFKVGLNPTVNDESDRGQYFHTYKDSNFPKMAGFADWTFVYMDLNTEKPNFNEKAGATAGCASDMGDAAWMETHKKGGTADAADGQHGNDCSATFNVYVGGQSAPWGQHIEIIDWTHGTRSNSNDNPLSFSENYETQNVFILPFQTVWARGSGTKDGIVGFWVSPALSCTATGCQGTENFGTSQKKWYMWQFPWHGAYIDGVWFCDMVNIPSGSGGFGMRKDDATAGTRRTRAREALYLIMMDTKSSVCDGITVVMSEQTHKAASGIGR